MVKFLALLILLAPEWISPRSFQIEKERLIVWNVGQGLWITWVTPQTCFHFDMGGEFAPWAQIRETCGERDNRALFSHWDWDHIGFAKRASRHLKSFCVLSRPQGTPAASKLHYFDSLLDCEEREFPDLVELKTRRPTSRKKSSNALSRVYLVRKLALLPGDSTSKEEKFWSRGLKNLEIRFLVLGHHGSKTSTSMTLIKNLPRLRLAVASARKSRYGHPHNVIMKRLKRNGIALLRTEDWGTLHWEVPRTQSNY